MQPRYEGRRRLGICRYADNLLYLVIGQQSYRDNDYFIDLVELFLGQQSAYAQSRVSR